MIIEILEENIKDNLHFLFLYNPQKSCALLPNTTFPRITQKYYPQTHLLTETDQCSSKLSNNF